MTVISYIFWFGKLFIVSGNDYEKSTQTLLNNIGATSLILAVQMAELSSDDDADKTLPFADDIMTSLPLNVVMFSLLTSTADGTAASTVTDA